MLFGVFTGVLKILLSEWTSPGADVSAGQMPWGRSLQSWNFDNSAFQLLSLWNLQVHEGNNKALLRSCHLAPGEDKENKSMCDQVDVTNCGK